MKHQPEPAAPLFGFTGKRPGLLKALRSLDPLPPMPARVVVDAARAKAERDAAVRRVQESTEAVWLMAAIEAVQHVAKRRRTFTVDSVQVRLAEMGVGQPTEGRAMGAAMSWAKRHGVIRATGRYEPSDQPQCHRNPRQVWESMVYEDGPSTAGEPGKESA